MSQNTILQRDLKKCLNILKHIHSFMNVKWRQTMGVEPTRRHFSIRLFGFENRDRHQPCNACHLCICNATHSNRALFLSLIVLDHIFKKSTDVWLSPEDVCFRFLVVGRAVSIKHVSTYFSKKSIWRVGGLVHGAMEMGFRMATTDATCALAPLVPPKKAVYAC